MHVPGPCTHFFFRFVFSLAIVSADNFCAEQQGNSKAQNNRTRTLDTPVGLVRTYYCCFVMRMCTLGAMSQRLLSAVNSACVMRWISFLEYSATVKDTVLSKIQFACQRLCTICICGGFSRIQCTCACAVDPNRYSALVHLRWIPRDYSALVSLDFSEKNCLALFFFFFSQFSALPPTHMFFNLRPVANFGLVLPAVLKFSAFRLQWGVFIALMLFMLSKYPSFTPECEGGSIQEKNGDCILRMWNKGCKDVKEI